MINKNNNNKDIKYIYDGEKFNIISFNIFIEKETITFIDEDNISFKVYNSQYLKNCVKILEKDYEFYDKKNQIKVKLLFGK